MKKFTGFFIIAALTILTVHAQNKQQINNLATLAKVWGFLKYYHPDAAKGNPDWDKELVKMIPLVKSAASENTFNKLITDWYYSLPKAKLSATITQLKSDTIERVFDETDIALFGVPTPLADEFTRLYLYHRPDSSKYITNHVEGHILDYIKHTEEPFATPALPDEEYRLLALFRYWNIIEYFYSHKKINTAGWDKVLPDFIPRFIAAEDSTKYRETFLLLTTQLKDSHSFFYQPNFNRSHFSMSVPFQLTYIDGKYYISESRHDSLMKAMGFKVGDEIVGINGMPVAERIKQVKPFVTGTNELSINRNIGLFLFRIDTNRVMKIAVKRQGEVINKTVSLIPRTELSKLPEDPRPLWENLGNGIWYVRFCEITTPDTLKKLFADLQQAKTVIWDMRAYPTFKVVQTMKRGLFAESNMSVSVCNSILEFPGAFTKRNYPTDLAAGGSIPLSLYKGKMIVLVNELTQSLSESVASELRLRPNTIVMGRQTAGTTGNVTWVDYPGGIIASFTAVGVKGLNDSFTEGKGVKIDKEITLSSKNLLEYPDYMLEMAYREALKGF